MYIFLSKTTSLSNKLMIMLFICWLDNWTTKLLIYYEINKILIILTLIIYENIKYKIIECDLI
jgi:hypothetical protein